MTFSCPRKKIINSQSVLSTSTDFIGASFFGPGPFFLVKSINEREDLHADARLIDRVILANRPTAVIADIGILRDC